MAAVDAFFTLKERLTRSSSVTGIVGLLSDNNNQVKAEAIDALLLCVDENWHEIADALVIIEDLASNPDFQHRKKTALLASKIAYHLNMLDEALLHAMQAEELFNIKHASEYTNTILAEAVARYCSDRAELFDEVAKDGDADTIHHVAHSASCNLKIDYNTLAKHKTNLMFESLVERMIDDARQTGKSGAIQALGITLEARRLDLLERIIRESPSASLLLRFCTTHSQKTVSSKRFRSLLQMVIVELYDTLFPFSNEKMLTREYFFITRALALTGDHKRLAEILLSLVTEKDNAPDESRILLAYQIAFDLVTFENQALLANIINHLRLAMASDTDGSEAPCNIDPKCNQSSSPPKDTDRDEAIQHSSADGGVLEPLLPASTDALSHDRPQDLGNSEECGMVLVAQIENTEECISTENIYLTRLHEILFGKVLLSLTVDFLHRENHTNLSLLDQIKNSVNPRSSVTPNGIVICHAFMQCGTTCDIFVRENLEWFGRAVCWAKFTVAAANGVLHKGHVTASKQVLAAYLPGSGGGPYSEGGALMALGLIHANRFDISTRQYLLEQLQAAQTYCPQNYEPLQHGACLGLGLLGIQSGDVEILTVLKDILFADSAVAGEAAAIAVGMVSLGSGSAEIARDLLCHAHETEHERAVRGSALGVAFVMYRKEEEADVILDQMIKNKDPMVRYGGMFGVGLAYCGTSNRSALRRLLHVGVSDVSSDVRRAAVMAIGFVACDSPNQVPRIVSLLADSFNPHVRYAAALAVGVGCCGTASLAAVNLLLPLTQDTTDFVRQGALLGLGLVLVQASSTALPEDKVQTVRNLIVRVAADKHEDTITRFGAIIAQGLIDMGGRNGTISFYSPTDAFRAESAVGLAMFCQLWFWYPYIVMASLAFRPTALMGLNSELVAPSDFRVASVAPPGSFWYTDPVKNEKKEEKRVAVTAVLSTAARRRQQEQMRKRTNTVVKPSSSSIDAIKDVEMKHKAEPDVDVVAQEGAAAVDTSSLSYLPTADVNEPAEEPQEFSVPPSDVTSTPFTLLQNPCGVVVSEEKYILVNVPGTAWVPLDMDRKSGVVMVKRVDSDAAQEASQDVHMSPKNEDDKSCY